MKEPTLNRTNNLPSLRTLDIASVVPVDLNSILYNDMRLLSRLYERSGNSSRAEYWAGEASTRRESILELHWNATALAFNDFNTTSQKQSRNWTPANLYPFWCRIIPSEVLKSQSAAQKAFAPLAYITAKCDAIPPSLRG